MDQVVNDHDAHLSGILCLIAFRSVCETGICTQSRPNTFETLCKGRRECSKASGP